jgi:hypothetical protein
MKEDFCKAPELHRYIHVHVFFFGFLLVNFISDFFIIKILSIQFSGNLLESSLYLASGGAILPHPSKVIVRNPDLSIWIVFDKIIKLNTSQFRYGRVGKTHILQLTTGLA